MQSCKCKDKRLVNQLRVSEKGQVVEDFHFIIKGSNTIMVMMMMMIMMMVMMMMIMIMIMIMTRAKSDGRDQRAPAAGKEQ